MWPWIFVSGIVAAHAGAAWFTVFLVRRRLQVWRDVAEACGLKVLNFSNPWAGGMDLEAQDGPLKVQIFPANQGARVVAMIPGPPGFPGVKIRREASNPHPEWMREIEVGDWSFDSTFLIEGPLRLVTLLLTAETRRLLVTVNDASTKLEIAGG